MILPPDTRHESPFEAQIVDDCQHGKLCSQSLRGLGAPCGRRITPRDPSGTRCAWHYDAYLYDQEVKAARRAAAKKAAPPKRVRHKAAPGDCPVCGTGKMNVTGEWCYRCRGKQRRLDQANIDRLGTEPPRRA